MQRLTLIIIFFIFSLLAVSIAFFVSFAPLKEGVDIEDLTFLLIIAAFLLLIIACWYSVCRRTTSNVILALAFFSIFYSIIPFILLLSIIGSVIYKDRTGNEQTRRAAIDTYSETFIHWPGFAHPVGLQVSIELKTPYAKKAGMYAGFYPPLIWMGPASFNTSNKKDVYEIYFMPLSGIKINGRFLAVLKGIVFSKEKQPEPIISDEKSTLTFNLYPGVIEYLESANAFCTYGSTGAFDVYSTWPRPDTLSINSNLTSIWFYAGNIDVMLSKPLTEQLRKSSKLENNPTLWANIHNQFNDDKLLEMGYHTCKLEHRKHCFCKEKA